MGTRHGDAVKGLSETVLGGLPGNIATPSYDRHSCESMMVHIGPGNFHRSHQGFYLDALRRSGDLEWGMRDVGIMPADSLLLERLAAQDGLYTIRESSTDGSVTHRVSGALQQVNDPGDTAQILAWLADPATKIVTLTITEGGYFTDAKTGAFRDDDPMVAREFSGETPSSVFGFLVRALARRRADGTPAFTLLSCDNLVGNGHAVRNALLGFARHWDAELADWIDAEVVTPSCMVDGITPRATPADLDDVASALGVRDECAVTCEPFRQWVIEDRFPTGRPRWEDVGVQFVTDVGPHEHMKLRMLNAAHQVMSHLGALAGFTTIHEVCQDPCIGGLLEVFWRDEAQPVCPPVPGVNLDEYRRVLRERFSNPGIADTVARNAAHTSDRIPGFVLPTVADNLASGGPIKVGALVVAAWAKYLLGKDDRGRDLTPIDDRLDEILPLVRSDPQMPLGLLDHPQLASVGQHPRFRRAFEDAFITLSRVGASAAARITTTGEDIHG